MGRGKLGRAGRGDGGKGGGWEGGGWEQLVEVKLLVEIGTKAQICHFGRN